MRGRVAVKALAVATVLTMLPGGCGTGSSPPNPGGSPTTTTTTSPSPTPLPAVQLNQSIKLTLDAPSKRITGSAVIGQYREEFDVTFVGTDAKGTRISSAPGISTTTRFVRVGPNMYINADEHYWQTYYNLEVLKYLVRTWVRVDAASGHSELAVLQVSESVAPVGAVTQSGTDTIDGTPVLVLKDGNGNTFFVAAAGEHQLIRFQGSKATEVGTAVVVVTFSMIGTVSETITPPTGKIFDPVRDFPKIASGHD
jgi:hypothetical protein